MLNIGRGDFEPKQHTVICSEHFRPECFSAFGNRKNLKHNAVPTVFAFQGPPQVRAAAGPRRWVGRRAQVAFAGTAEAEDCSQGSAGRPRRLEPSRPCPAL